MAIQANEHDSILVFNHKIEMFKKQNEELTKEILELKKQLGNANFQLEKNHNDYINDKIDIELRNNILEEDNKRLNTELYQMDVIFL